MATITAKLDKFSKGKALNPGKVKAGIKNALDKVAKDVKADYKATMATWEKQKTEPVVANAGEDSRLIYVPNKIYGYVDLGTRPHVIRPKTARRLAFRSGFVAKTSPGVIGSGPGGSFGGFIFAKKVNHPGNKPRLFSKTIASKRKNDLQKAIDREFSTL